MSCNFIKETAMPRVDKSNLQEELRNARHRLTGTCRHVAERIN